MPESRVPLPRNAGFRYSSSAMPTAEATRIRNSRAEVRSAPVRRPLHEIEPPEVDDEYEEVTAPAWFAVARGAAFFVGCVTLLNLLAEMQFPQFSAATWWVDLQPLPKPAARGFLAMTAGLLVLFSLFPAVSSALRRLAAMCTLGLFVAAMWNAYRYYQHYRGGQIQTDVPLPFALHVAACVAVIMPGLLAATWDRFNVFKDFVVGSLTVAVCVAAFPLAQFFCFGKTNDRGATDAVVVFADGAGGEKTSEVNIEQIRAACALYRSGQAHKMVLAGQSRPLSEAAGNALRRAAVDQGIPDAELVVSATGTTTETAIADTVKSLQEQKFPRVLIVAPFYTLPRIKLCCQRGGLETRSVPLHQELRLEELQPALVREGAALWMCYLQPLLK